VENFVSFSINGVAIRARRLLILIDRESIDNKHIRYSLKAPTTLIGDYLFIASLVIYFGFPKRACRDKLLISRRRQIEESTTFKNFSHIT